MLRLLSSLMCTAQSTKAKQSPLTSSCVNLMLLSTALMCTVKSSPSRVLILTQVSSTYLNQWLGAVPVKVIKAQCS